MILLSIILSITLALESIHAQSSDYLGCYQDKDNPNRDFNGMVNPVVSASMSSAFCKQQCRDRQFKYVGLQNGRECWCGPNPPQYGKVDDALCATACAGAPAEKCGANLYNSVYLSGYDGPAPKTGSPSAPPTSSGSGGGNGSGGGSNIGAIVGGVIGGVFIIAGVIMSAYYFARRSRRANEGVDAQNRPSFVGPTNVQPQPPSQRTSEQSYTRESMQSIPYAPKSTITPIKEDGPTPDQIPHHVPESEYVREYNPSSGERSKPSSTEQGSRVSANSAMGISSWVDARFASTAPAVASPQTTTSVLRAPTVRTMQTVDDAKDYSPRLFIRNPSQQD